MAERHLYSSTAYAPFGEQYAKSGTSDASFTGQGSLTASSLYDFTFRRMSQSQGRWISPDPAGLAAVDAANPQSWNRYVYVTNNPLALVDSLGLCDHNEANEYFEDTGDSTATQYSYCVEIDNTDPSDCNSIYNVCVYANADNCNSDTFGCYGYFDPASLPQLPYAPIPPPRPSQAPAPNSAQSAAWKKFRNALADCAKGSAGTAGAGAGLIAAGSNVVSTAGKFAGSTAGTSIASQFFRAILPQSVDATWAPTLMNPLATSGTLGGVVGRWVPIVGEGLLGYSVIKYWACLDKNGDNWY